MRGISFDIKCTAGDSVSALFAKSGDRSEFQLIYRDGEFVVLNARIPRQVLGASPIDGAISVDLEDVEIEQRGNMYARRGADECESWL